MYMYIYVYICIHICMYIYASIALLPTRLARLHENRHDANAPRTFIVCTCFSYFIAWMFCYIFRIYWVIRVYAFHISRLCFSHIYQKYLRRLRNLRDFLNFPFKFYQKRPITVNLKGKFDISRIFSVISRRHTCLVWEI
jgi:hypothetical protein